MKTILVLNTETKTAAHGAIFALGLASQLRTNIVIATVDQYEKFDDIDALEIDSNGTFMLRRSELLKTLFAQKQFFTDFLPVIQEVPIQKLTSTLLLKIVEKKEIHFAVVVIDYLISRGLSSIYIALQAFLVELESPLLVIPSSWNDCRFNNFVYYTDLRKCDHKILHFLVGLAKEWNASILIVHSSAIDLRDVSNEEVESIFEKEICKSFNYRYISLKILTKDKIQYVLEVILRDFNADLFILVDRSFNFTALSTEYIDFSDKFSKPIPLLIFPN